jgi:hypothetical protein
MKFLRVFGRFAHAFLFYPVMIGLFLWLYFTKAHWIFGVAVIVAILILDPIWRTLARNIRHKLRARNSKK